MRDEENEAIVVITTAGKAEEAQELARRLIEARLAACVQIEEIRSLYRWEGRIEEAGEFRLQIKTLRSRYGAVEKLLRRHHPYETPEIIALPIVALSEDYRAWLERETLTPPYPV